MIGWLIYDQKQYDKNKWFAEEIIKYCSMYCSIDLIIVEKLRFGIVDDSITFSVNGSLIKKPDFAICRTIYPLLSYTLESANVRVFNSYAISQICNDKRYTYALASKSNMPIMKTLFLDRSFPCEEDGKFGLPCILKTAEGHGGNEVFWINDEKEYKEISRKILTNNYLMQQICRTTGKDLRVYVLGGNIIAAVLRVSDGFKSNYSLGGRVQQYTLNNEEIFKINRIISLLPTVPDFVGIDFLYDKGTLIFNEIEDVVGSRMLYKVYDVNVAQLFSEYVKNVMA